MLSPSPQPLSLQPRPQSLTSESENGSQSDYSGGSESVYSSESDSEPSVKKQKVNEEDVESNDFKTLDPLPLSSDESCTDCDTDEEWFRPTYPDEKIGDKACWERYFQQIHESEGFDIKDNPGSGPMTTICPMSYFLEAPANVELLKGYAAQALKQYNEKSRTNYEANEILKLNGYGCRDFIFYITISVKNGEHKYFQVKAVERLNNSVDFPIVRPRATEDVAVKAAAECGGVLKIRQVAPPWTAVTCCYKTRFLKYQHHCQ